MRRSAWKHISASRRPERNSRAAFPNQSAASPPTRARVRRALMPSLVRALVPLALFAAITAARGDDPPPGKAPDPAPPAGQPAPGGQPAGGAQASPPPDPAREQAFQDKAAEDALVLIRKPGIADAMEGIDRLA